MAGNATGGMKAAKTNKARYGEDFYRKAGRKGGMSGRGGGFRANPDLARIAGAKGGKISKRGPGSVTKIKIEPLRDKILEMLRGGNSISEVSRELDLPDGPLRKWVKRNGEEARWGK